jgi:hypothetical protein
MGCEGVDWTDLARDKDKSMTVVNSEKQIWGFIKRGVYKLAGEVLAFQYGPCCSCEIFSQSVLVVKPEKGDRQ